jgi:hypothetical protein
MSLYGREHPTQVLSSNWEPSAQEIDRTVTDYLRSYISRRNTYDNRYDNGNKRFRFEGVRIVVTGKPPLCYCNL